MSSVIQEKKQPTIWFKQEKFNYCGPACCEMFLSLPKISVQINQSDAYNEIQKLNEEDAFYSDPKGVSAYLEHKTLLSDNNVGICSFSTYNDALAQINFAISQTDLPCVILALGGAHWIILNGLRFSVNVKGINEISAFLVQDPSANSPTESYIFPQEFRSKLTANTYGQKWLGKFVVLSPKNAEFVGLQSILITNLHAPMPEPAVQIEALYAPGAQLEDYVKLSLIENGFQNVNVLMGGGAVPLPTISVKDLDRQSNYTLVPQDATQNPEFKDYIYVAVADNDKSLLEAATLSKINIFTDDGIKQLLQTQFPNKAFKVEDYVWKRCIELRSRLSVACSFTLDGVKKFLLPDGRIVDQFTQFDKGGY